jgi:hypothetical protein
MLRSELEQKLISQNAGLSLTEVDVIVSVFLTGLSSGWPKTVVWNCAASGRSQRDPEAGGSGEIRALARQSTFRPSECPTSSRARKCASG